MGVRQASLARRRSLARLILLLGRWRPAAYLSLAAEQAGHDWFLLRRLRDRGIEHEGRLARVLVIGMVVLRRIAQLRTRLVVARTRLCSSGGLSV